MSTLNDNDVFLYQDADGNTGRVANNNRSALQDEDVFLVQREGTTYRVKASDVASEGPGIVISQPTVLTPPMTPPVQEPQTYSDGVSSTNSEAPFPSYPATNLFDGNISSTYYHGNPDGNAGIVTITFDPPVPCPNTLYLYGAINGSQEGMSAKWSVNDLPEQDFGVRIGSQAPVTNTWNIEGDISKITITKTSTNGIGGLLLFGVQVGDDLLVDEKNFVTYSSNIPSENITQAFDPFLNPQITLTGLYGTTTGESEVTFTFTPAADFSQVVAMGGGSYNDLSDFTVEFWDENNNMTTTQAATQSGWLPAPFNTPPPALVSKLRLKTSATSNGFGINGFYASGSVPIVIGQLEGETPEIILPNPDEIVFTSDKPKTESGAGANWDVAEWQVATDLGFSADLQTSTSPLNINIETQQGPTDFSLEYDTTYYTKTRYKAGANLSVWSEPATFETAPPPPVIATPQILTPAEGSTTLDADTAIFTASPPTTSQGTIPDDEWNQAVWVLTNKFTNAVQVAYIDITSPSGNQVARAGTDFTLEANTEYKVQVTYTTKGFPGNGIANAESAEVNFTTAAPSGWQKVEGFDFGNGSIMSIVYGAGKWLVMTRRYSGNYMHEFAESTDGINWSWIPNATLNDTYVVNGLYFSPYYNKFYRFGNFGIQYSSDGGNTWTNSTFPYSNSRYQWVAMSEIPNSGNLCIVAGSGATWGSGNFNTMYSSNGSTFNAAANATLGHAKSGYQPSDINNLQPWMQMTSVVGTSGSTYVVGSYGASLPSQNTFPYIPPKVMKSYDYAVNWTDININIYCGFGCNANDSYNTTGVNIKAMAYDRALQRIVAVGDPASGFPNSGNWSRAAAYSDDMGNNWTLLDLTAYGTTAQTLEWGQNAADENVFVMPKNLSSTQNNIMWSTNGINWNESEGVTGVTGLYVSGYGNKMFLASNGNTLIYSYDGKGDPWTGFRYDTNTIKPISFNTIQRRYGLDPNSPILDDLGFAELTEQPDYIVAGYERQLDGRYKPIRSYENEAKQLETRIALMESTATDTEDNTDG